jgi:hypothetical protein
MPIATEGALVSMAKAGEVPPAPALPAMSV